MKEITTPRRGDYIIKKKEDKSVHYIALESISSASDISDDYEIVAVVAGIMDGKALGVRPEGKTYKWCDVLQLILTGYTLDGAEHSGVLSIRDDANATANTDYTVTYSATSKTDLCAQLNAFFEKNASFNGQEYYAFVDDSDNVVLQYTFTFINQESYFTAKDGFALTKSYMTDVSAVSSIRRKNGNQYGEGVVVNMNRALSYFVNDNSTTAYNPVNNVASVNVQYPICLPGYLGTSQYRDGDKCELLRSVYGEGKEGWQRFMRSFDAVNPTDYGGLIESGKANTLILANKRYSNRKVTDEPMCKAAYYCHSIQTDTIDTGEFWLPSLREMLLLMYDVKYSVVNDRNADVLNRALYRIGWSSVSNGSNAWSSCRSYSRGAWFSNGYGFINSNNFFVEYVCHPVSLYPISKPNL